MTAKIKIPSTNVTGLASSFHISMDRSADGLSLILSGATSIKDLSDRIALFRVRGFYVKVTGSNMSVTVYENKTAELSGRIEEIEFVYDKT